MRKESKKTEVKEKVLRLCSSFSLLDEKEQEYVFTVLTALLFAKLKMETLNDASLQRNNQCFRQVLE